MAVNMGPKIPSAMVSATLGSAYYDQGNAMLRALQALLQCNVISMTLTTPPSTPANGDMYVVGPSATGAWSGKAGQIAYWSADPVIDTPAWEFYAPAKGWTLGNQADGLQYKYSGSAWTVTGAATMTSSVGGLVPTPPNDATKYLDGTGNFSTPSAGSSNFAQNETTGGTSPHLTLAHTPITGSLQLFGYTSVGGANYGYILMVKDTDYTLSGSAITITNTAQFSFGATDFRAWYRY